MLRKESHKVPMASIRCLSLLAVLVGVIGVLPASVSSAQAASFSPSIESESVSHITSTDAILEAQINPGGLETTYEIWIGTVGCIEEGGPASDCESTGPGEIVGTIPAGTSTTTVSGDIAKVWSKLAPNSSYVFTVSATNSAGKANSNYKIFKTAAGTQPAIASESVSSITPTDATLEAQINSEGLETSYQFRLESGCLTPRLCPEITVYPLPSGKLLGSFLDQNVSLDLNSTGVSLGPGVEYAYTVTATNAAGSATSHEQRFTTPENSGSHPPPAPAPNASQGTAASGANDSTVTPSPQVTALTKAQKLAKALKACKRKPKRQRPSCAKQAHRKYTTAVKKR
jgi:hypothetical protein